MKPNLDTFIRNSDLRLFIKNNIQEHLKIDESKSLLLVNSFIQNSINKVNNESIDLFVNINKLNDILRLNKYLIALNKKLKHNGLIVINVETLDNRKVRILQKTNYFKFTLFYPIDFFYKRIMPKTIGFKKIYFAISKGKNRVLSKCEIFGRLYFCGFELIDLKETENRLYIMMRKIKQPETDKYPSYHFIYKKKSIGKNEKIIFPYKFRTMHPYAEYLHKYLINQFGYSNHRHGRPANDFRLTSWGRLLRKYWLDELPQLINILKGEMRLVGARPFITRFNELPDDVQKVRIKYKPGCIPPYISLLMPDEIGNIKAERIYFNEKKKHPIYTDLKYFFLAIYNITTNKIRSN